MTPLTMPMPLVVERRRRFRWLRSILTRGRPEPLELLIASQFVFSGAVVSLGHANVVFGVMLLVVGSIGIAGLAANSARMRAWFAFLAVLVRAWMFLMAWLSGPHEALWTMYITQAVMLTWAYFRIICRDAFLRARAGVI